MKLVTVEQMKAIEKQADAQGLTYDMMMDNAGQGLAEVVQTLAVDEDDREVLGLVGPGNNGGDTVVALTHLAAADWRARAYLIKRSPDALVERFKKAGGEVILAEDDQDFSSLTSFAETSTILLDGVLGTGVKPPLKGEVGIILARVLEILDEAIEPPYVIAVDCPSGVDCDSGEVPPEAIPADLTVTMAAVKQGLMKLPAYELIGDLQVVDIGLPADLPALTGVPTAVAEADLVASILPQRPADAHKGTFGTALIRY